MTELVLLGIAWYMFNAWILPIAFELATPGGFQYIAGYTREPIAFPEYVKRLVKSGGNLQESIAIYLALAILSIILNVENQLFAMLWLFFRLVYFFIYVFGIPYIRTLIWIFSVICLIGMTVNLIP